ncbi:MAG: hypothetical protein R3B95_20680 [Nitrospirales bacterium]|nr:hypothetical protein [Nitrospirales bacterium]
MVNRIPRRNPAAGDIRGTEKEGVFMLLQQINEPEGRCRYCGHVLFLGQTEEGTSPVCSPSVRIGFVCPHYAAVEYSPDGLSFEA